MADIFSSHPYPGRKQILPGIHFCQTCEKTIAFKDKMAHERGKKHKQIVAELDRATAQANGTDSGEYGFTSEQYGQPVLKDGTGCHNCGGPHMAKECTQPRRDTRECHNCKKSGHISKDCPDPPQKTCRNCLKVGHIGKECTEPRNPATVTCNNCDNLGHFSRDCPEPKNWSKVVCNNCNQTGHTMKRCTNEAAAPVEDDTPVAVVEGDWMDTTTTTSAVAPEGDWANPDSTVDGADSWGATVTPAVAAATDGW